LSTIFSIFFFGKILNIVSCQILACVVYCDSERKTGRYHIKPGMHIIRKKETHETLS